MYPLLSIDLCKIEHNTKALVERCTNQGIEVIGVTKCCLGSLPIAEVMSKSGVSAIGDSRLASLRKLARAGIFPLTMLRQPMKAEAKEVVKIVDISLISQLDAAISLSKEAAFVKKEHSIILMIEAGDLREGILPGDVLDFFERTQNLPYLKFLGIGTNVACMEGTSPSTKNLELLKELSDSIENKFGTKVSVISGGNSSALKLLERGEIPQGINQIRIGEGILLGQDTVDYEPLEGFYQDAFLLSAEVIEVQEKALHGKADSWRKQAVLALGRQDIADGRIKPLTLGLEILRTSSDHLVLNLNDCPERIKVGDTLTFIPSYFALLAAMTSPFVQKKFCGRLGRL